MSAVSRVANWPVAFVVTDGGPLPEYVLSYLATPDDGLSGEAVMARAAREAKSADNVRSKLSVANSSLRAVGIRKSHSVQNIQENTHAVTLPGN